MARSACWPAIRTTGRSTRRPRLPYLDEYVYLIVGT